MSSPYGQYGDSRGGLSPPIFILGAEASVIFFVIASILYAIAHWRNWLPKVYASRRYLAPDQCIPHETPPHRRHFLSWLVDSWPIRDKDILRYYGLDALLFLRSLKVQSVCIFLCALYGLAIILPVNLHGKAIIESDSWGVEFTTAHLGPLSGSKEEREYQYDYTRLFLCHILGGYFMTFVTLYLLWRQYGEYVELRHAFRTRPVAENYTILVHHIPGAMRSNAAIATYFENLFPNSVKKVTIMLELPELEAMIAKRDRVANRLEWARVVQADHAKLRCSWCRTRASIDCLVEELSEELPRLDAQVKELQDELIDWHVRHERYSRGSSQSTRLEGGQDLSQRLGGVDDEESGGGGGSSMADGEVRGGARGREEIDDDEEEDEEGVLVGQDNIVVFSTPSTSEQGPLLVKGRRRASENGGGGTATAANGNGHGSIPTNKKKEKKPSDIDIDNDPSPSSSRRLSWALERLGTGRGSNSKHRSALHSFREKTRKTFRFFMGNPVGATAFVSFRSLAVAAIAGRCITYRHPLKMSSKPAPQPDDIIWANVYMPMRQVPFKTVLGLGCAILVTLFFSVVVGIIASLTNVKTLNDHVPFMRDFLEHSKVAQELLPYLPAFLLVLVDSTIPPILSFFCRVLFREVRTVSAAHTMVFRRLYAFLMYNNFLILFLSSSLNTYYAIVEDPHTTLKALGSFLPNISSFYIAYIMIKVLCSHPMELTRMSSYCVAAFRWIFTDDLTEAQKKMRIIGTNALERPGGFYYGRVYADNLFVFTITMTFALVAPLILPFALAFFFGALVVYKRQLLFVYEPEFESAGTFWPKTYRRMVAALYFMQLSLLCILITNEAFKEIAYLVPLPILTMVASLVITRSYHDAAAQLPLSIAMEMDEVNKTWGESYDFLNGSYIQPALRAIKDKRNLLSPISSWTRATHVPPHGYVSLAGLDHSVVNGNAVKRTGSGGEGGVKPLGVTTSATAIGSKRTKEGKDKANRKVTEEGVADGLRGEGEEDSDGEGDEIAFLRPNDEEEGSSSFLVSELSASSSAADAEGEEASTSQSSEQR